MAAEALLASAGAAGQLVCVRARPEILVAG